MGIVDRMQRQFSVLVLVALLVGLLPQRASLADPAQPGAGIASRTMRPAAPQLSGTPAPSPTPLPTGSAASPTAAPVTPTTTPESPLPSLTLATAFSPTMVSLNEVLTLTLTVANQAAVAAQNMTLSLPVPSGAIALDPPGPTWTWAPTLLAAHSTATFTATMRVVGPVSGGALQADAQVSAQGLALPIHAAGGVLVVPAERNPVRTGFTPGTPAVLHSADGQIDLAFPGGAYSQTLTLQQGYTPPVGQPAPPTIPGFHRGWGPFYLDATDDQGQPVHQFAEPLTLTLHYTPQQLQALNILEEDLSLFWFDATRQDWVALATQVDPATQTATTQVDHLSAFALSDGSSPSAAFIPAVQGWQVSLFTGSAGYSYPIEVPAGPGGIQPHVALTYNSAATDGATGQRRLQQAGWVGKGWSLDTGAIAVQKTVGTNGNTALYYTLAFDGQSFELTRGACLPGAACNNHVPSDWEWRPTDESFIRVRVVPLSSQSGRGGSNNFATFDRYKWQVWTKGGVLYEFSEDAWWGWDNCAATSYMETYKWLLSRVQDTFGNTIT